MGGFNCSCIHGFAGSKCQYNIDDCDPNPCKNGAKCIDYVNAYDCLCSPGFTGKFLLRMKKYLILRMWSLCESVLIYICIG